MAPALLSRADNILSGSSPATRAGLITLIVVVTLIFISVVVLLIVKRYKRRQYETVPQKSPYMASTAEFSVKPRKISHEDVEEHQELQRQVMIRKSLASRTSTRIDSRLDARMDSRLDSRLENHSSSDYDSDEDDSRRASLMSDWKEYEANVKRERSTSLENHPSFKHPSERTNEGHGQRVTSPSPSELSMTVSPRPSSLRNTITAPPPAVSSPLPPPYSRLVRSTIQVPPPRRATFDHTKTAAPRRATFDSVKPMPRRGTFDAVPEEYTSVPLAEVSIGKPGYNWI